MMTNRKPKAKRLGNLFPCLFEPIEARTMLSVSHHTATTSAVVLEAASQPSVADVNPTDGKTDVPRDIFIACDLNLLANSGTSEVDPDTLAGNVTLTKTSDNANVIGTVKTSGGGDSIVFTPSGLLVANASYTFKVTSGVKDLAGNSFVAFTSTFTTGTKTNSVPSNIRFDQVSLPNATGHHYTAMLVGPDGNLYAADDQGYIYRYVINPDGTLGASKTITSVRQNNIDASHSETFHGARIIAGMAFDPTASPKHPVLWITSGFPAVQSSPNWTGKVSKLSGTNLSVYQDEVVNLPRSFKDHLTEGISFGPDGAIYISQASNSAMGATDTTWANRPEQLLNAAILRLDPSKLGTLPLDAKTAEGGTYNPFSGNAPLTIYADGIRNAYQPVWTDDGHLFAATNGSSSGGNAPAGASPFNGTRIDQSTNGPYTGPTVPPENDLPTQPDFLYDVKQGGYYGHPNPLRNEFVENGGNPTSGVDKNEVANYPVGTHPDRNYRGSVFNFGSHESPDGSIEYKGSFFGGALKGDLLVAQYAGGSNIVALSRSGGKILSSEQSIAGLTGFNEPLALAEDTRTGNIYVGEYGGASIMLLRVNETPLAKTPQIQTNQTHLLFNAAKGASSGSLTDTLVNGGVQELDITSVSITGTDAADFKISAKPTLPAALQPGQSTTVSVKFSPSGTATAGLHTASLTIKSNDPGHPTFNIQLRGIVTASANEADEPSLQNLLDLYQLPVNASADEVKAQLFARADASKPIEMDMLAAFDTDGSPVATLGSYSSADGTESALFSVNAGSNQTVSPSINGPTTFFAGAKPFGLFVQSTGNGHTIFSENLKNSFDSGSGHLMHVYTLKNSDGSTVANAYIVAVETSGTSGADSQDIVFEIRNVMPVAVLSAGPPSPPTNLQVTNSVNVVGLAWSASDTDDVTGYIIKRSTNSKANFITLTPSPIAGTTYTDRGAGQKKYYYRVFAVDSQNRLSDPAKISTTVTAAASSSSSAQGLSSADIGAPAPAGSTHVVSAGEAYDLTAGGTDVQGASDQFRFAYTQVTGDFDLKVRVASLTAADVWSKAGLMARSTLDANSRNVFVLTSPTKNRLTYRVDNGGPTSSVGTGVPAFPNAWLRLSRAGNTFTGYSSTDGSHWTVISSVTFNLGSSVYVGLAATSHNSSATTTAQFRDFAS